jgi:hypothetical protein
MRRLLAGVVYAAMTAALGALFVAAGAAAPKVHHPYCPQEDSCSVRVDYSHGEWHLIVTEETP